MPKVTVTITGCLQNLQEVGVQDEQMSSKVYFSVSVDGGDATQHEVLVKQTVGSSYGSSYPLEVGPTTVQGPFNYNLFRDEVEKYYRGRIGAGGAAISIGGGAGNITMSNNRFGPGQTFSFDVPA